MSLGDSLDISKQIKNIQKGGENLSVRDLKRHLNDAKFKVKTIDEKRLQAIEESKDEAPIKKMEFEKQDETEKDIEEIITEKIEFAKETEPRPYEIFKQEGAILLIIVLLFGAIMLSATQGLSYFDDQAHTYAKKQIAVAAVQQVQKEWPLLGVIEKTKKANELLMNELAKPEVTKQIRDLAASLKKEYRDPTGQTYLVTTQSYNSMINAKEGNTDAYSKTITLFSKITKTMRWTFEKSTFYLPIILAMITMTCVYFIIKQATKNRIIAVITTLSLVLIKEFFINNSAGNASTIVFVMTITTLAMLMLTYVIDTTNKKKMILGIIGLAITLIILKTSWTNWQAIIAVICAYATIYLTYLTFKKKSMMTLILAVIFAIPAIIISKKILVNTTILPLMSEYTNYGAMAMMSALILVVYAAYKSTKLELDKYQTLAIVWAGMFFAYGIYNSQFNYLATAPFAIIIGLVLNQAWPYLKKTVEQLSITEYNEIASALAIITLLFLTAIPTIQSSVIPEMNNQKLGVAQYITANSTIITWGEQGYYYQYYSNGKAYIPNEEQKTKLAKALLSQNPEEIRLLANNGIIIIDEKTIEELPIIKYYAEGLKLNSVQNALADFFGCIDAKNNTILCKDYLIDVATMDATKNGQHPSSLTVYSNETQHKKYTDTTAQTAIILIKEAKTNSALAVSEEDSKTMLVRMFAGENIPGMKKVTEEKGLGRAVAYKITD